MSESIELLVLRLETTLVIFNQDAKRLGNLPTSSDRLTELHLIEHLFDRPCQRDSNQQLVTVEPQICHEGEPIAQEHGGMRKIWVLVIPVFVNRCFFLWDLMISSHIRSLVRVVSDRERGCYCCNDPGLFLCT
jgi:hypothetical protein